jgi:hypothetical protein
MELLIINILLFGVVYQAWYDFVMDSTDNVHQILCKSRKKVQRRSWELLDERSGKEAWAIHLTSKLTEAEKGETVEEQSQEHAHNFVWHQKDC